MARVGAAHRVGGSLATGRARTDIQRRIPDQGAGAQHVPHVGMGAPIQVGVGRGLPGVRISYDHRFEASGPTATRLEWLVELRGPLAFLVRPIFARVYGRNVDRAISRLQDWFRRPVQTAGG